MNPQGEGLGDDEEADDLLTLVGGGGGGGESLQEAPRRLCKNREKGVGHLGASLCPRRPRKMSLEHIEVCFQGSVRAFMEIASFTTWVNSVRGLSKVIGIRGVSAKSGPGNQELSNFMTSVLHIEGTPGRWRRRSIGFLQKRCGHRLTEERAVRSMAEKARETRENKILAPRRCREIV